MGKDQVSFFGESQYPLALVTGAAHRLGKAFALSLANLGYAIILHYHSANAAAVSSAKEFGKLGVPVFPIKADLLNEDEINAMFSEVDSLIGNPDMKLAGLKVLVNSAAIMSHEEARILSIQEFDRTIGLNLRAPFLCSQLAYKRMSSGGVIVNISDVAAQKAWVNYPAYTVSKAGLESLTKVMARSFAPKVRVNAISPGLSLRSDLTAPEVWKRLVERVPLMRTAKEDELTAALEFLLKNEYITGQTLVVDGGYSLI